MILYYLDTAASKILAKYSTEREGNMDYDRSIQSNAIVRDKFIPLLKLDAEVALGMLANGFNKSKLSDSASTLVSNEKIDKVPNQLSVDCVAKITRAISEGYGITCNYLSENSANHKVRTLIPVAIMYDGVNWMFRAYHRDGPGSIFKNFHLSRAREVVEYYDILKMESGRLTTIQQITLLDRFWLSGKIGFLAILLMVPTSVLLCKV
ncbi:hypothetical protein A9Q81_02835 [Gammaproteobacteria bacterium 42_54_T18]|nr:hypothetical protein A9Q81_02835 [Gammaproteobacteria bacterium 42_54_T18]